MDTTKLPRPGGGRALARRGPTRPHLLLLWLFLRLRPLILLHEKRRALEGVSRTMSSDSHKNLGRYFLSPDPCRPLLGLLVPGRSSIQKPDRSQHVLGN